MACKRAKIARHNHTRPETIQTTGGKFAQVHLDLVGPLTPNDGKVYLLTMVDRYTRWVEVAPIHDSKAETVSRAFIDTWISRYGVPESVTTDRGPQFESHLWKSLMETLGSVKITTTAYNPRANGIIERFHRRLKESLKAQPHPYCWLEKLPLTLLSIRTAIKEDLGYSSAELMFGTTIRLPSDLIIRTTHPMFLDHTDYIQRLKSFMNDVGPAQSRQQHSYEKEYIDPKLKCATHVLVRTDAVKKPLQPPYHGPYKVIARTPKYYTVQLGNKQTPPRCW
uniref:Retrovirus-related Pol polyprotein from transposon 412 n=1 Tax=Hirondellea gigas TaxID=1518452 RepID=A0A2P2I370_9CRUS